MPPESITMLNLKLSMAVMLAAWVSFWVLKPTKFWKTSWHDAEDWATTTFLGASGLDVVVFCFPILALATLGYIYLHASARRGRIRLRAPFINGVTNPIVVRSPIGVISGGELLAAVMFVAFLFWTYYSNVSSDLKKMAPSKTLKLNRWQLRVMMLGVRFGSLSEACLAIMLLPVLRGMALFRILGIQYEASVRYHIWIANALMLFSVLHGTFIMFIWGTKKSFLEEIAKWQRTGRVYLAGAIALAIGLVIWITSLPQIRRQQFQLFYSIHHLYVVFLLFFLLHAGDRHFYLVLSGVLLFTLDKILRIIQSLYATNLISASILPCKAVELTLPKHHGTKYTPTSIIFVKVPSISKFEWHPFSITSSSYKDDNKLSILVKCQGQWTNSLYNLIQSMPDDGHAKNLSVAVEGPYGPAIFPCLRYDSLILVAGGSGITPFLSILQDIASRVCTKNAYPENIRVIHAVKRIEDISLLASISPLLLNQSSDLGQFKLKIFVTQEERPSAITAKEVLNEMSQVKTIIFEPNCSQNVVPSPGSPLLNAAIAAMSSLMFLGAHIGLNHIFVHRNKKSSENKAPSWVADLLVIFSLGVAVGLTVTATVLLKFRKSAEDVHAVVQKKLKAKELVHPVKVGSSQEEPEINFGKRPNLTDALSEFLKELGESNIGIFVCGPDSMQESVASFCKKYVPKKNIKGKTKCSLTFHSINFSL